jgi:hypothetical protein
MRTYCNTADTHVRAFSLHALFQNISKLTNLFNFLTNFIFSFIKAYYILILKNVTK